MVVLLEVLIRASETAANIARSCCEQTSEETLVITEKCGNEANSRFDKDFKTIVDVLAQEAAKKIIVSHCPELSNNVSGEETPEIGGVVIKLKNDQAETCELLKNLMSLDTAEKIAAAAHTDVTCNVHLPSNIPSINPADLGIWIDPIDATAEFIAGVKGDAKPDHGLSCVTVLIGAYLQSSGKPVIGVINQPFYQNGKGRIIWGFTYNDINNFSEIIPRSVQDKIVLMSGSERKEIKEKFSSSGWQVKYVPGAGHKLMRVALGEVSAYIVSQGTTFRWDTCAPHAILLAKGGNVISYSTYEELTYNGEVGLDTTEYCNKNGIIAYLSEDIANDIKNILSDASVNV